MGKRRGEEKNEGKKGRILRIGNAGLGKEKEEKREEKNEGKKGEFYG